MYMIGTHLFLEIITFLMLVSDSIGPIIYFFVKQWVQRAQWWQNLDCLLSFICVEVFKLNKIVAAIWL